MKINIIKTVTTVMDEDRKVLSTREEESYLLKADINKILVYQPTGKHFGTYVCEYRKNKLANYIEVDDPKVLE